MGIELAVMSDLMKVTQDGSMCDSLNIPKLCLRAKENNQGSVKEEQRKKTILG